MGPRRQSHPLPQTVPPASCVSGTWGPHTSLPGPRDCQRSRLRRAPEKARTGSGEETKSSPTWHQNRTSSKKQSLLYSSCSWPAYDRRPSPTRAGLVKSWETRAWPPSGQCTELRKVSLHDTGERRAAAGCSRTRPPPALTSHPPRSSVLQAASWRGDSSRAGLQGGKSKRCPRRNVTVL